MYSCKIVYSNRKPLFSPIYYQMQMVQEKQRLQTIANEDIIFKLSLLDHLQCYDRSQKCF